MRPVFPRLFHRTVAWPGRRVRLLPRAAAGLIGAVALVVLAAALFVHNTRSPALDESARDVQARRSFLERASEAGAGSSGGGTHVLGTGRAGRPAGAWGAGVPATTEGGAKPGMRSKDVQATSQMWEGAVDPGRPRCAVDALPFETRKPEFEISWRAFGPVTDLDSYTILVSVDNGTFAPLVESTRDRNGRVRGEFGHSYGFLCIATDKSGSIEKKRKSAPDAATTLRPAVIRDVDGDGKADILWRHVSGVLHIWFMDGEDISSAGSPGRVTSDWTVLGLDDFNGDDKADILWRHSSGLVAVWLMGGTSIIDTGFLGGAGGDWTIQGVGDFNGDVKADILWRHSSGVTSIWLTDGRSTRSVGSPAGVGTEWTVQGVGDFDGDGKADILWRHALGVVSVWLMDGHNIRKIGSPGGVGTEWTIQGVGDFNGDGRADILWRHASGVVSVWLSNGTRLSQTGSPGGVGPDWTVQDVVDLDGDGNADIVWRHSSGVVYLWLMNGVHIRSTGSPGGVGPNWAMQ